MSSNIDLLMHTDDENGMNLNINDESISDQNSPLMSLPPPLSSHFWEDKLKPEQADPMHYPCPPGGGAAATGDFDKVVDYFSVVGSGPDGMLQIQNPPSAESLRDIWANAITDVVIVKPNKGELCPPGFELVQSASRNFKADLNCGSLQKSLFLAIQRQYSSKRSEYISDIRIVYTNQETLPPGRGWELINKTVSGSNKATLNRGSESAFLAVRRVKFDPIDGPYPLVSLCVVLPKKGEVVPKDYRTIERNLSKGKFGGVVYLAYQLGRPISICHMRYKPEILDRYPHKDSPSSAFPQEQLPMFVYPKGILLEKRAKNNTPKPKYFSFVFTNVDGRRTYAACLTFHEPVLTSAVKRLIKQLKLDRLTYSRPQRTRSEPPGVNMRDATVHSKATAFEKENEQCLFAPKTICVISRFPVYSVLRRFLRHLYAISLSEADVPLERYISTFVSCVPMPIPGGRRIRVYLSPLEGNDGNFAVTHSRLNPLELQAPPHPWLPLMDVDFGAPFRCLSIPRALAVFSLVLQEAKILFISSRAELLTQVMEALRSLIFPLEWQSVYVPHLPRALSGCLECPGGFMIGMHLNKEELSTGTEAIVYELGLEGVANAVNLDTGEVLYVTGEWAYPDSVGGELDRDERRLLPNVGGAGGSIGVPFELNLMNTNSDFCEDEIESMDSQALNSWGVWPLRKPKNEVALAATRMKARSALNKRNTSDMHEEESPLKALPNPLLENLTVKLRFELYDRIGLRLGSKVDLDQFESAFEFAPVPDMSDDPTRPRWRPHFSSMRITSKAVREAMRTQMLNFSGPVYPLQSPTGNHTPSLPESHPSRSLSSSRKGSGKSVFPQFNSIEGEPKMCLSVPDTPITSCEFLEEERRRLKQADLETAQLDMERGEFEGKDNHIIRDAFVCAMAELLGGIHSFVRLSEVRTLLARGAGNVGQGRGKGRGPPLEQLFNMTDFLATVVPSVKPFLERITTTQMFWVLVQQLLESSERSDQLVFFEECVTALRSRQAGAVAMFGNTYDGGSVHSGAMHGDSHILLLDEVRLTRTDLYPGSSLGTPVDTPNPGPGRKKLLSPSLNLVIENILTRPTSMRLSMIMSALDTELSLMDSNAAPLIIPGPTKVGLPPRRGNRMYRYDSWPTPLNRDLIQTPPEALPQVILQLQTYSLAYRELHGRRQHGRGAPLGTTLMYGDIEPMVVIPLEVFEAYGEIPRSNDAQNQNLTVSYSSLKARRQSCLVLYVSHRWLRPRGGPRGAPAHPDADSNVKHALICDGARRLIESLPLLDPKAYLWLDYTCIDQDDPKRRSSGIQSLPSYIERCDALLIPYTSEALVDESPHIEAEFGLNDQRKGGGRLFFRTASEFRNKLSPSASVLPRSDIGSEYSSKAFKAVEPEALGENSNVHINPMFGAALEEGWRDIYPSLCNFATRAWCRCELFMATAVPIPPDGLSYFDLVSVTHRVGERPVFVYGPEQRIKGGGPMVLPRLDKTWFEAANPEEGALTNESDRRGICALVTLVRCSARPTPKPGYAGQRRFWQRHGRGKMVFDDGNIYDGEWKGGQVHGYGVMEYSGGSKYSGDWRRGQKYGHGIMVYPDGASYDGQWQDGRRHGYGRYISATGAMYTGQWEDNRMHGEGTYLAANGSKYVGDYYHGKRHGHGVVRFSDGRVYDGKWKSNERHGRAVYTLSDGSRFEGTFVQGYRHGRGIFSTPKGSRMTQDWKDGRLVREERISSPPKTLMSSIPFDDSIVEGKVKLDDVLSADMAAGGRRIDLTY